MNPAQAPSASGTESLSSAIDIASITLTDEPPLTASTEAALPPTYVARN